jgi:hypothetical protein
MRMIDARLCDTKRTTRSSIVSPSMRRIDDNNNAFATFDVFIEGCVYIFNSVKKKKERKISLLYSFSKERSRSLSLSVCFSVFLAVEELQRICARSDEKEVKSNPQGKSFSKP